MKRSTIRMTAALLGVVLCGGVAMAGGSQFRESITVTGAVHGGGNDHRLTFSGPVSLPGVSLGPGTYIFRRPSGGVLQVVGMKGQSYAMLQTTPVMRAKTDGYSIVLGPPAAEGSPRRIVAWFVAGEGTGQQLIYPNR